MNNMINANLVTCLLCHSYYADPRQISCSHSFCFDCISGRFDDKRLLLICPKCDRIHQYNSREEFENRCMHDGHLASMVTQFKRNQSRSSAISSGVFSRPPSTYTFTPIRSLSQEINSNPNQSYSERSTPSSVAQQQQQQQSTNRLLIAKCQSCNIRGELIICNHCDNVICIKCVEEHQSPVNNDVKREWNICKMQYETINERSMRFETDQEECECEARKLQTLFDQQAEKLMQTIDNHKNSYSDLIEKHRQIYNQFFTHEQVIDEYESINTRVGNFLRSTDITAGKIGDFLFEIEHLEDRLDNLNKLLDSNQFKFPMLTSPEQIDISSLFGTLEFVPLNSELTKLDPYLYNDSQSKSDDEEDYIFPETPKTKAPIPISNAPKKKLLWQLDYKSVPYYIRTHDNQLFICDKYGYLSIYKSNDFRQKPIFFRDIKLFPDENQTIIDSFVISQFWLIILKRKKTELNGIIYLFTHDGKLISNGGYLHNYPSRELTMDFESNLLWSLDQQQLSLFYYQLPQNKSYSNKPEDYFHHRYLHVQFPKTFAPKHISVNKHVLAVLDKNRQSVHVYDKKSQQELYEYVNIYNNQTHFCWDMALFSNSSLLIKLDEMSTLKIGPSKHIYLQLDRTNQHNIIGIIEEMDAYGMIITSTDEILIGGRINTKGTVKCYV